MSSSSELDNALAAATTDTAGETFNTGEETHSAVVIVDTVDDEATDVIAETPTDDEQPYPSVAPWTTDAPESPKPPANDDDAAEEPCLTPRATNRTPVLDNPTTSLPLVSSSDTTATITDAEHAAADVEGIKEQKASINTAVVEEESTVGDPRSADAPVDDSASAEPVTEDELPTSEQVDAAVPAAPSSWLGSWWSGTTPPASLAVDEEPPQESSEMVPTEATDREEPLNESPDASSPLPLKVVAPPSALAPLEVIAEQEESSERPTESVVIRDDEEVTPVVSKPVQLDAADQKALDEAFQHHSLPQEDKSLTTAAVPIDDDQLDDEDSGTLSSRNIGRIHKHTSIPNSDVGLRLLRKFACKTRRHICVTYGGSKPRSIVSYLMSPKKPDPTLGAYRELMEVLWDDVQNDPDDYQYHLQQQLEENEGQHRMISNGVVPNHGSGGAAAAGVFLGDYPTDDMARARRAMAAYVHLASLWGFASASFLDASSPRAGASNHHHQTKTVVFVELLGACWDTASLLVAHGCLDGVLIRTGGQVAVAGSPAEYHPAVNMLALSIFNSDLMMEQNELAAMKFLLTTGCRNLANGEAILRGSHLLQTIRTLYHIYLTTESRSNRTTAKASLQQLVSSVFARVVHTDVHDGFEKTTDGFPSENHRDAFLVLRAICKLSMRSLPDPSSGLRSHVGIASSGSNATWNGGDDSQRGESVDRPSNEHPEHAELIYTAAIHPALESKLLALDLIFYVLNNTDFSRGFIARAGSQFHAAVRNYLCVSLLKNCTSNDTQVVNVSLRLFAPLVRSFRTILKNEIEAFVTNVFFVILDSKNSPAEHKSIVVNTFEEICSDPSTLAEIFLNYDCDLSAVDLFHRIVNTLSKIARSGLQEPRTSGIGFMGGASAARQERERSESRELRLDAMKALRQVLASLHASTIEPIEGSYQAFASAEGDGNHNENSEVTGGAPFSPTKDSSGQKLVDIYDSKKRRRVEESEVVLRFNQKPSAGIAYAVKCGHVDGQDASDVAMFLLKNKDTFEKAMIGEYLGREPEYQGGFSLRVLHEYVRLIDFEGLGFDEGIRLFLSGFRLPGEAQKIDRIMEKFAERYTEQNKDVFPSADVAFILAFSIIMLNTDLHNPAIKEDRRMTRDGFIRNNRGICDGQNLPDELLYAIFDRIQANPISLKEDDEARERAGDAKSSGIVSSLGPTSFFASHYEEMDRARESNFQKERDHIVRTTEALLKRRRHGHEHSSKMPPSKARAEKHARPMSQFVRTEDSGLRDEYVSPMFDVAWGPALAAFSTAMESANGTVGALIAIASDDELEFAAENAAETIEVCLTGFRFAVCTAGLCGNHVARDAFVLALTRFSQLGTGTLLEPRHVRCIQTLMSLARDDGELLGATWEHIFRSLSEINRYHQLFHIMARNDRVVAAAAARRQRKVEERERRRRDRDARLAAEEDAESLTDTAAERLPQQDSDTDDSLAGSDLFDEDDDFLLEEDMDARAIDEANARVVYDAVSETVIETIYERSATLSAQSVKDFVKQLCFVSRSEISVGGASLLYNNKGGEQFHHNQVNIYCLQKLVEVSHYNMESRPRLIFSDLWSIVADHLTFAALHFNPAIAMYAVDSFRQLSIHYLKRDELEVFEFQKRFLKPLDIVMAQSEQSSTKELLLNCVDRIILVFKPKDSTTSSGVVASSKGGLRSGWIPILSILGIAGVDPDRDIAKQSFKILMSEILLCLKDKPHSCVLLSEHFVEAVSALFMFISGPHDDISRKAMETLLKLTEYLVKDGGTMPQVRRKATTIPSSAVQTLSNDSNEDLELWWPILLGLSRAVGDSRPQLRLAALETLMKVITGYFFPSDPDIHTKRKAAHDDIQTLQIVFRGVLFPILEYAELDSEKAALPSLPANFERFLTVPLDPALLVGEVDAGSTSWLETMFDPFLDACISLCLRSILVFKQSPLIDEVLALLTNCLMSDSGLLAVRGLHRLEQFLTSDLSANVLNDEIWAAVSHMLRKCLLIRDLPALPEPPKAPESQADVDSDGHDLQQARKEDYLQSVKEFVDEDAFFRDRRYIPSNATMVIGMFLSSDHFTIGLRWRLFLIAGLGRGIVEWERAAILLEGAPSSDPGASSAPSYNETAMYGRMWMNRFILQLASVKEIAQAPADADVKSNRFAAGRKLVAEETQRLLSYFLKSEHAAAQYSHYAKDEALHTRYTSLVMELLSGFGKMDGEHLKDLAWINPVLLGTCIQSKNENIRLAVQKLVQRMAPTPSPYPAPTSTSPAKEAAPLTPTATDQSEEATEQPVDLDPVQADDTIVISDPEVDKSTPALVEEVVEASSITIPESPDEVLTESDRLAEGVLGEEEAATPPAGEASSFEPAVTLPEDYVERAEQLGLSPLHVVQAAFQKADTYVLDIRTDEEIALGFIAHPNWKQCDGSRTENAILSSAPETIVPDKNATIILYCQSGRRANKAKEILLEQGYTGAILNAGGYEDMKAIL